MEKNRQTLKLVSKDFSYEQMLGFVNYRAGVLLESKVFNRPFVIDSSNKGIIELLCLYFSRDKRFEQLEVQFR
jgi:hypothetical protein